MKNAQKVLVQPGFIPSTPLAWTGMLALLHGGGSRGAEEAMEPSASFPCQPLPSPLPHSWSSPAESRLENEGGCIRPGLGCLQAPH